MYDIDILSKYISPVDTKFKHLFVKLPSNSHIEAKKEVYQLKWLLF